MRNELKVGLFIIVSTSILVFSYLVLGSLDFIKGGTSFKLHFKDLTGLKRSTELKVKGVAVGKIKDIYLDDSGLGIVEVWVKGRYKLAADSKFYIRDLGIMGEKYIMVVPGKSSTFLQEGTTIRGETTASFQDISKKANAISDTAQVIINRIKDSIDPETIASLRNSMLTLQKMIGTLNSTVTLNKKRIDRTFKNIESSSKNVKRFTRQDPEQVSATLRQLHRASRNLSALSTDLRITSKRLDLLLVKIDSNRGTLGKMINDPSLYNNLNGLLKDIKRNPKRYIHIRVF